MNNYNMCEYLDIRRIKSFIRDHMPRFLSCWWSYTNNKNGTLPNLRRYLIQLQCLLYPPEAVAHGIRMQDLSHPGCSAHYPKAYRHQPRHQSASKKHWRRCWDLYDSNSIDHFDDAAAAIGVQGDVNGYQSGHRCRRRTGAQNYCWYPADAEDDLPLVLDKILSCDWAAAARTHHSLV